MQISERHIFLLKNYGVVVVGSLAILLLLLSYAMDRAHERALCTRGSHLLFLREPIVVNVLETPEERTRGLSGREVLPPDEGVVFAFGSAGSRNFWMKDMHFPIDVLFFDAEWRVIGMFSDMRPESYPHTYGSPEGTYYALEAVSGFIEREEIANGTALRIEDCTAIGS